MFNLYAYVTIVNGNKYEIKCGDEGKEALLHLIRSGENLIELESEIYINPLHITEIYFERKILG